jgi:hypothetical protein
MRWDLSESVLLDDIRRRFAALHGVAPEFQVLEGRETTASEVFPIFANWVGKIRLPEYLILKVFKSGWQNSAEHELFVRNVLDQEMNRPPMAQLLQSGYTREGQAYFLMVDLTQSHHTVNFETIDAAMGFDHCLAVCKSLAGLHAAFWNSGVLLHDRFIAKQAGPLRFYQALAATDVMSDVQEVVEIMVSTLHAAGSELAPEEVVFVRRLTKRWPNLWLNRIAESHHLTLIHGDAHPGNVFWPSNEEADAQIVFVDWETTKRSVGACEVAYFLIDANCSLLRSQLLLSYFNELYALGVTGYTREMCEYDYELGMLAMIFVTISRKQYKWAGEIIRLAMQSDIAKMVM